MSVIYDNDGNDTLVVLSENRAFTMRSETLIESSGLFEKLLSVEGPNLTPDTQAGGIGFQVVLQDYDLKTGDEIVPVFRRVELDEHGAPARPITIITADEERSIGSDLFDNYTMILESFSDGCRPLTLKRGSMKTVLKHVTGLMDCAEHLDSVQMVAKTLDNAVLSLGKPLFQDIARSPFEWIDLGFRLSSKAIFREATIHLTGRYNSFKAMSSEARYEGCHPSTHSKLDELRIPVREVIERKAAQLREMCKTIESRAMAFYPYEMHRVTTTGRADRDSIGRQSYASDIYLWQAVAVFRHYMGQCLTNKESHEAEDGGCSFYTQLHKAGISYLDNDDMESFHTHFPMTRKGRDGLRERMHTVKNGVSKIVEPLFISESCLDRGSSEVAVTWLTCIHMTHEDFPWVPKWTSTFPITRQAFESDDENHSRAREGMRNHPQAREDMRNHTEDDEVEDEERDLPGKMKEV